VGSSGGVRPDAAFPAKMEIVASEIKSAGGALTR